MQVNATFFQQPRALALSPLWLPEESWGERSVLLALATTAYRGHSAPGTRQPDFIVGQGFLGRMIGRLAGPATDTRRNDQRFWDVSGVGLLFAPWFATAWQKCALTRIVL